MSVLLLSSLHSRQGNVPIFDRVLNSYEKCILYDTPKHAKQWLWPQNTVPHITRPLLYQLWFIHKWWTLSCYQLNKPSLRISTLSVETCEIRTEVDGFRIGQSRKCTFPPWQSPPRLSQVAMYTIRRISWKTQCHPFYSLDLSPNDYSLYHFLEDNHGKSLPNEEDLQ